MPFALSLPTLFLFDAFAFVMGLLKNAKVAVLPPAMLASLTTKATAAPRGKPLASFAPLSESLEVFVVHIYSTRNTREREIEGERASLSEVGV